MLSFIEGTLLISNILLILFSIIYGILIVKKKQKDESSIWIYFLVACGLFFLSELLGFASQIVSLNIGLISAVLRISFGIVVLFAFLSKYSSLSISDSKHKI
jgi:hypothetical protein